MATRVKPIDQRTLEALEESKVAVVMTSETESYSVGFLEELIAILEFQEKGTLTVIPIFLTANSFGVGEICQQHPEYAQRWRTALTKLANIAAECPFSRIPAGMSKSDHLEEIADDICLMFLSSASNDLDGLVAMDRHMEVVYGFLASEFNGVRTIGIWGSVGVGKTTLARYTYAKISVNFQTHVFLENVENMKDKILQFEGEEEDPTVITSLDHHVNEITEARRKHRKFLLIADDVSNVEQGKWIIEYANRFASGSTVILISQNKNLLVDAGVMHLYEVRTLRYDEALQLFSHFAFKKPNPPSDFEQLAVRAVHLAGFLPLALRLLGSFLTGRGREEWVAALLILNPNQGENIMEVWKLMEASENKGKAEWEAVADTMEGKEPSQDEGQEERQVSLLKRYEKEGQDLAEALEEDEGEEDWDASKDKKIF